MRAALGVLLVAALVFLSLPFQGWGAVSPGSCGMTQAAASVVTGVVSSVSGTPDQAYGLVYFASSEN